MDADGRLLERVVRARSHRGRRLGVRPAWLRAAAGLVLITGGALAVSALATRGILEAPADTEAAPIAIVQATLPQSAAEPPAARGPRPDSVTGTAAPVASGPRRYIVQAGDTLQSIAATQGLRSATLASVNDVADPDLLQPGRELLVPATDGIVHVVQAGETLRTIAARYAVDLQTVIAANDLADPDRIAVGLRLFIPTAGPTSAPDQVHAQR